MSAFCKILAESLPFGVGPDQADRAKTRMPQRSITEVELLRVVMGHDQHMGSTGQPTEHFFTNDGQFRMNARHRRVKSLQGPQVFLAGIAQIQFNVQPRKDAGTVKTDEARDVPLHLDLIDQGFVTFATTSKAGPLFLIPAKDGDVLGPLQGVKNRLGEFVREVVSDPGVQPNHGWRHRFKSICRDMGVDPGVRDAIQGHAARSVADEYGEVSITAKAIAIDKLPRYAIEFD